MARAALSAAQRDQDLNETFVAEAEWEHITRVARTHGVGLAQDVMTGPKAGTEENHPGEPAQGPQR